MVDYSNIKSTLTRIEVEYNNTNDQQLPILYSKLAVLEFCGWIEVSIDDILEEYIDRHVYDATCRSKIKKIIKKNYGFDYENNLFPLFSSVLGINNLDNILDNISTVDFYNLKSLTETYTTERNKAAHTDTPIGTTRRYPAPSSVLHDYNLLEKSIRAIENEIKKI